MYTHVHKNSETVNFYLLIQQGTQNSLENFIQISVQLTFKNFIYQTIT